MSNPPSISLSAGIPQAFRVVVTANGVQADGSNPGVLDTSSVLTIENVQNANGTGVLATVDPGDNRRVVCTPGVLAPGGTSVPWSFRVKVPGRTSFVTASGTTAAPADVSGVSWDGNPVAPA